MDNTHYNDPGLWFHIVGDPRVIKEGDGWQVGLDVQVDLDGKRQYKIKATAVLSNGNKHVRTFTLTRPTVSRTSRLPLPPYASGEVFPLDFNIQLLDKSIQVVGVHVETIE